MLTSWLTERRGSSATSWTSRPSQRESSFGADLGKGHRSTTIGFMPTTFLRAWRQQGDQKKLAHRFQTTCMSGCAAGSENRSGLNFNRNAGFKGYDDFVVQELKIETYNMRYRLQAWQGPDGQYLKGQLPESVDGHYGAQLKSYVLYQYHHQRVTQPLLLEQLHAWGVEISAGQLNHLLTEKHDAFHAEKAQLLEVGLQVSRHIQTDDTGARHNGKNGYCTYIGNELFAWFESTESTSRVNFLSLLRAGHTDYVLHAGALEYMARHKLPQSKLKRLEEGKSFPGKKEWDAYLEEA